MDRVQRYIRDAAHDGHTGRRHYDTALRSVFGMRHDLHNVLLSVPVLVPEEQMLQRVPHLQLGLRDDVHAAVLCQQDIHMEPSGAFDAPAHKMGDHVLQASGEVLRAYQRIPQVQQLHREALRA